MTTRKKIIAISGSTREHSTNLDLINAISVLFSDVLDIQLYKGVGDLPHFNPDLDADAPPAVIAGYRLLLKQADGVIICTPEYAMGVPGSLKNAIDWTVSSGEFSHKPVALITASLSGHKGHVSLMETLKVLEAEIPEDSQLVISFVKTKVKEGQITDADTVNNVKKVISSLLDSIDRWFRVMHPYLIRDNERLGY